MKQQTAQTIEEKLSVIDSIPTVKGIFGFEAITEEKALKKSRIDKTPTPAHLEVIHKIFRGTVYMGDSYQEMINKRREKEGSEADFQSQATYCEPVGDNKLIWKNKNTDQLYLRVYLGYGSTMTSNIKFYDAEWNEIPMEEYREIKKKYLKLDYAQENQQLENEIVVRNYKIENVVRLKRGEEWL